MRRRFAFFVWCLLGSLAIVAGAAADHITFNLPSLPPTEATGPGGARVSFEVTATAASNGDDDEDEEVPVPVSCDPSSGGLYPLGETTVVCQADGESASLTVAVVDTTPPEVTSAADLIVEANGPSGSVVRFSSPDATDIVDGPLVTTCSPASGSTFPLGTTQVRCRARDSSSNTGSESFSVDVRDTTPPALTAPASITVVSATAVPAGNPAIAAFLAGATAADLVDKTVSVTNDGPPSYPVGTTTVTFTATDDAGNSSSRTANVVVVAAPSGGSGAAGGNEPTEASAGLVAGIEDDTPPDNVRNVRARGGDHVVRIKWALPRAADLARVVVTRGRAAAKKTQAASPPETVVYEGRGTSFVDRGLRNGVSYRYVITSYDASGNRSAGVAVVAKPTLRLLAAPVAGARLMRPPLLRWVPVRKAKYYNVQLYRGKAKVLSAWPSKALLKLERRWRYGGNLQRLRPGRYTWYVWPGFGSRAKADYGSLLGKSTFTVLIRA